MNKLKKFKLIHLILILTIFICAGIAYAQALRKIKRGLWIEEVTAPGTPDSGWGALYTADNSGTMTLYFKDDAGTATDLITATGRSLDEAYDDGGSGTGRTITADSGAVTINNTDADNANNLTVNKSPSSSASGSTIGIVSGANCTGNSIDIANSGSGYDIDGTSSTWYITKAGALTCASATITTFYQSAIAAAASGNTALTIDAAGTGTITLAGTSTGRIINTTETDFLGAVDIGDAATDTLTITSIIDSDLTLDDGSGAPGSFILKDGSDETSTFAKVDGGYTTITTQAADGVNILTGSLKIGNGSPGSAPDGEDLYVEGDTEIDGSVTLDGAVTANGAVSCVSTLALSENVTFTMAADEYLQLDANTTAMTQTAGAIDINLMNGANNVSAIHLNIEAENGYANLYGMYIDIDDDGAGGDETIRGVYVGNSAGTASVTRGIDIANTIDDGIVATLGAATQALVIDAATTDHTGTSGTIDINFDTSTDAASAINIDLGTLAGGSDGDDYSAILIDLDDDTDASADIIGVKVTSSDVAGSGGTLVIGFYTSGLDQAFQADNGYFRLGTGSTASQTLGDDDGFVEGHWEVDGTLYPDGDIVGDGATKIYGIVSDVSACVSSDTLTIAECGNTITNSGATGTIILTLPEGSTCHGCEYTFAVLAAQQLNINPADGTDQILGITNAAGDSIQSNAAGDCATVVCVGDDSWVVKNTNNSTNSADGWADAN